MSEGPDRNWDHLYDKLNEFMTAHHDLDKRVVVLETRGIMFNGFLSVVFGSIAAWLVNALGIVK